MHRTVFVEVIHIHCTMFVAFTLILSSKITYGGAQGIILGAEIETQVGSL